MDFCRWPLCASLLVCGGGGGGGGLTIAGSVMVTFVSPRQSSRGPVHLCNLQLSVLTPFKPPPTPFVPAILCAGRRGLQMQRERGDVAEKKRRDSNLKVCNLLTSTSIQGYVRGVFLGVVMCLKDLRKAQAPRGKMCFSQGQTELFHRVRGQGRWDLA